MDREHETEGRTRKIAGLTLFGAAFGVLEAAVVVYLRELYYPDGFGFPIVIIPDAVALVEIVREAVTLVMLFAVALVACRDRTDRFFAFGYMFGVWDIVYYVGLRLFVGWPTSWLTWDVLFLIPVPWLGPVIYPLIISILLITAFVVNERLVAQGRSGLRPTAGEWAVATAGAATVIVAFCWNWRAVAEEITPESFPVAIFAVGLILGATPFGSALRRASRG